jgi:ribonuclease BN (tRNA processing enzyme)
LELTVLGCSGSYGGPLINACSGYLVRSADTTIWLDSGNGTFGHLQQHVDIEDLTGVVLTHEHPDHCVDLYGLHVLVRYGIDRKPIPVFAPVGLEAHLGALVGGDWGGAFEWNTVGEGDHTDVGALSLAFSRTDHPPPTYAVEVTAHDTRLVYTSDTGPGWSVEAFGGGADLVLSEATYLEHDGPPIHLTAQEAGSAAREAGAKRLMLTHLQPHVDQHRAVEEGSDAFGQAVMLAAPHLVTQV